MKESLIKYNEKHSNVSDVHINVESFSNSIQESIKYLKENQTIIDDSLINKINEITYKDAIEINRSSIPENIRIAIDYFKENSNFNKIDYKNETSDNITKSEIQPLELFENFEEEELECLENIENTQTKEHLVTKRDPQQDVSMLNSYKKSNDENLKFESNSNEDPSINLQNNQMDKVDKVDKDNYEKVNPYDLDNYSLLQRNILGLFEVITAIFIAAVAIGILGLIFCMMIQVLVHTLIIEIPMIMTLTVVAIAIVIGLSYAADKLREKFYKDNYGDQK